MHESISGWVALSAGMWNGPLFDGLPLCTSIAYLRKTSLENLVLMLVKNPGNWKFEKLPCLSVLQKCLSGNQGFGELVETRRKALFSCQDLKDNYQRFHERHSSDGYYVKIRRREVGVLWARFLSIRPISGALDIYLMRHSSSPAMRLPFLFRSSPL